MTVPFLTREQCRSLDRRAIHDYGIPGLVLMENAGRGCVDVLERLGIAGPVVILCGKGNNAGDGFVIARHLEIRGHQCRVLLLAPPEDLTGDAATNFAILRKTEVPIIVVAGLPTEPPRRPKISFPAGESETLGRAVAGSRDPRTTLRAGASPPPADLLQLLNEHASGADWLIDALLGTGAHGEPRPPFDTAINWMNAQPAKKFAVDVPSGLNCDTGAPSAHTVRANHTCTFAAMKVGFTQPATMPYLGTIHVCDIGIPPRLIKEM